MIGQLALRDRSVRIAVRAGMFSFVVGYAWSAAFENNGGLTLVDMGVFWLFFAGFLVFAQFWTRATEWEMALPVTARTLWCARAAALLGSTTVLLGATVLMATIRSPRDGEIVAAGIHVLGGLTLTLATLMAMEPGMGELELSWRLLGASLIRGAAAFFFTTKLMDFPAAYSLISFGLAAAIFAWTYRAIPPGFRAAPEKVAPARPARRTAPRASRAPLAWTVYRIMFDWQWWLVAIMIGALGAVPGGRQFSWLVVAIMPVTFLPMMRRLPALAHLPVSRRLIFALGTLPVAVIWLLGLTISELAWGGGSSSVLLVYQPGGAETLTWMQLRLEPRIWAMLAVFCGVLLAGGQMVQLAEGLVTMSSSAKRAFLKAAGILYGLVLLCVMWLTIDVTPAVPEVHESMRYHGAEMLELATELFPAGWVAWLFAIVCLAVVYRFVESRFMKIEARGIPEC